MLNLGLKRYKMIQRKYSGHRLMLKKSMILLCLLKKKKQSEVCCDSSARGRQEFYPDSRQVNEVALT
jgi:hypothetical protein